MSTHNIGFYEDLTKIIFELSSNIIKYAPYFFCWFMNFLESLQYLGVFRRPFLLPGAHFSWLYLLCRQITWLREELWPVPGMHLFL